MNRLKFENALALTEDDEENEDDGDLIAFEERGFRLIERSAHLEAALTNVVEEATSSADLVDVAKLITPDFISDRLEEIFLPPDAEGEGGTLQPELLLGSLREFLSFCLRVSGGLDERFVPGRTYEGELEIQLLDDCLGDLSIRFCDNRYVLVAVISDVGTSSGRCLANSLCTVLDHFNVTRWV